MAVSFSIHFDSRFVSSFSAHFCLGDSSCFSQLCLGFSIVFVLLQSFLLFLLSLDDKSATDLTGLCQNEYSDIEDKKW